MRAELENVYGFKTQVPRPDKEDLQQVRVLNTTLTWTKNGTNYEADPRHAEIVIEELGLKDADGVVPPRTTEERTTNADHETKLDDAHTSRYQGLVARLNDLTSDRPDIAFSETGWP